MSASRTWPTSFRLSGDVRRPPSAAAARERRSQTAMLEEMVLDWCRRNGLKPTPHGGAK